MLKPSVRRNSTLSAMLPRADVRDCLIGAAALRCFPQKRPYRNLHPRRRGTESDADGPAHFADQQCCHTVTQIEAGAISMRCSLPDLTAWREISQPH
jgi:hypothetical protein